MSQRIIDEVCRVSRATGADFPDGTITQWMDFAEELDADSSSSLHDDMMHDKPMDVEAP